MWKCNKCGGTIAQYHNIFYLGAIKNTGKRENYMCLNCGEIYKSALLKEIAKWIGTGAEE